MISLETDLEEERKQARKEGRERGSEGGRDFVFLEFRGKGGVVGAGAGVVERRL